MKRGGLPTACKSKFANSKTDAKSSANELAGVYRKRVEVEFDIRNFKVTMDIENIRAETVDMFRKKLLTFMVSYNLVVQFRRQAAQRAGLKPRQLRFTNVWNTYRVFLLNILRAVENEAIAKRATSFGI